MLPQQQPWQLRPLQQQPWERPPSRLLPLCQRLLGPCRGWQPTRLGAATAGTAARPQCKLLQQRRQGSRQGAGPGPTAEPPSAPLGPR